MYKNAHQTYHTNKSTSVGKAEFTALLFTKAAQHIQNTIRAIEKKDPELRFNETEKARAILLHLQASLDRESTEPKVVDLVKILDGFYMRTTVFLTQINLRNDIKLAEAVIHNFREMAMSFYKVQQEHDQNGKPIELPQTGPSEQLAQIQGLREPLLL